MTPVIEARGLTGGYRSTPIVRDLDLAVGGGEVVALLGPNGAGKTTTLLTLSGQLPAMSGEVLLFGQPTKEPLNERARRGLGLLTEQRAVLMTMSVADNFRVGRGDTDVALRLFPELVAHLHRRVSALSGGQQQMLALALLMSRRPKVILADELSLGLAPIVVDRLLRALRDAADTGVGVLLVEQQVHRALAMADRAYVLRRGRLELSGTGAGLLDRIDEVLRAYLATSPDSTNGSRRRDRT